MYELKKSLRIRFGVAYSVTKYRTDYHHIVFQPNDPLIPVHSEMSPGYLEFPMLVEYFGSENDLFGFNRILKSNKIQSYIVGGLTFSKLVSEKDETLFANNVIRKSGYLNTELFSFNFGGGVRKQLSNKTKLKIEVLYEHYFSRLDAFMKDKPEGIQFTFGFTYTLK